ncbi:hypothetical protein CC80DRAFT_598838 [Byssothecium circinans]|uniref:Uncharacterized protein n=1 Tax=Byssothecium circinans TaxID=147558 RepID=A0A6A5TB63_9PLEO|nr:hypothetical protein CC80DRAFT_598838 [Byssothecium circinans]
MGLQIHQLEPSGFRTDWAGRSMDFGEKTLELYDHVNAKKNVKEYVGDPTKAAQVFYDLATMKDPPIRCVIDKEAHKMINAKHDEHFKSVKQFEKWSNSTDVDE